MSKHCLFSLSWETGEAYITKLGSPVNLEEAVEVAIDYLVERLRQGREVPIALFTIEGLEVNQRGSYLDFLRKAEEKERKRCEAFVEKHLPQERNAG